MSGDDRPILVTGGAGFIGCNLADRLLGSGQRVIVLDNLSRAGVEENLRWLQHRHGVAIEAALGDVRDSALVNTLVRDVQAVFHMAAQVAVTTSLDNPADDFGINLQGTFNVLEAARRADDPPAVVFASTNKVYGDLGDIPLACGAGGYAPADPDLASRGIGEARPLDFHTPYGCSKGAADQYVLDYARSFAVPAAVLRMSCIYGRRQLGTEDQGWVAHFLIRALEGREITLYGDGHQVRDVLDVRDAVNAYVATWQNIGRVKGTAFNLGGGPANAISLRTFVDYIVQLTGRPLDLQWSDWRQGDQRYFVADTSAADRALGLGPKIPWREGVADLADWLADRQRVDAPSTPRRAVA